MRNLLNNKPINDPKKTVMDVIVILSKGILAVDDLMAESAGVVGFLRNGEIAQWKSFQEGGDYSHWLKDFVSALNLVEELFGKKEKKSEDTLDGRGNDG